MNENNMTPAEIMTPGMNYATSLEDTNATSFCSFLPETPKEKALLFKGMNNPDKRIGECINEVIMAKDVFCETVTCTNQQTGEVDVCPRVVIFDAEGKAYQAVSMGVYSALKKVIQVFGMPTWDDPIPLKVRQITKGERKLLTFDVDF